MREGIHPDSITEFPHISKWVLSGFSDRRQVTDQSVLHYQGTSPSFMMAVSQELQGKVCT